MIYQKLLKEFNNKKLKFIKLNKDDIFKRISLNSILTNKENSELTNFIDSHNKSHNFYYKKITNVDDVTRLIWFDNRYKYSTILYRPSVVIPKCAEPLETEQIFPHVFKSKIIYSGKRLCENVIYKDGKYIIIDEEVLFSDYVEKRKNEDDIIKNDMFTLNISEIFKCEYCSVDDCSFIYTDDKYAYVIVSDDKRGITNPSEIEYKNIIKKFPTYKNFHKIDKSIFTEIYSKFKLKRNVETDEYSRSIFKILHYN